MYYCAPSILYLLYVRDRTIVLARHNKRARVNFESENPIVLAAAAVGHRTFTTTDVKRVYLPLVRAISPPSHQPTPTPHHSLVYTYTGTVYARSAYWTARGKPKIHAWRACYARAELEHHAAADAGASLRDPKTFYPGTGGDYCIYIIYIYFIIIMQCGSPI